MRLVSTSPAIHQGMIKDVLPTTTITDSWIGVGGVFGKLWT